MTLKHSVRTLTLVAVTLANGLAIAGDDAKVVARVGDAVITTAELNKRLSTVPPAQLANLGGTPAELPRRFLEQVMVPELLTAQGAKQRAIDKTPKYGDREREVLRQALEASMKAQILSQKPVTPEEIKAYYDENKSRFQQPFRIRLWRILVDDEATAKQVLAKAKDGSPPAPASAGSAGGRPSPVSGIPSPESRPGSTAKWGELAREYSVDKATNLHQGDLGFVHPDGNTENPRVRVDAALFRAAQAVKDGDFVLTPVKEAGKWAVVWRRGSLPEKSRTLEQERDTIRNLLERRRVDEERTRLVQDLRKQQVKDEHPNLLEQIPDTLFGNQLGRTRQPPTIAPRRAAPPKPPEDTARGLR